MKATLFFFVILLCFAFLFSNLVVEKYLFPSPQWHELQTNQDFFLPQGTSTHLYLRGQAILPSRFSRAMVDIIGAGVITVYCNGNNVANLENAGYSGGIVDLTEYVTSGKNILAIKVFNQNIRGNQTPKISINAWYMAPDGSIEPMIKPEHWKSRDVYPVERVKGVLWYQNDYKDFNWCRPVVEKKSPGDRLPIALNPRMYTIPLTGHIIAPDGVMAPVGNFIKTFYLPNNVREGFIRVLPSSTCFITFNGYEISQINSMEQKIQTISLSKFLKRGKNELSIRFYQKNARHTLFLDGHFFSANGTALASFATDMDWIYTDLHFQYDVLNIRRVSGAPLPIVPAKISLMTSTQIFMWLAAVFVFLSVLAFLLIEFLLFFNRYRTWFDTRELFIAAAVLPYLPPLLIVLTGYLINRDIRVQDDFLNTWPFFWAALAALLSIKCMMYWTLNPHAKK